MTQRSNGTRCFRCFWAAMPDDSEALCVRRFDGSHQILVLYLEPGKRCPFNCGAAQRVLLAHLPDDRWEGVVREHVRRMTQYSLVSRDELERDRREIQERGYSVSWKDVALHVRAGGAGAERQWSRDGCGQHLRDRPALLR